MTDTVVNEIQVSMKALSRAAESAIDHEQFEIREQQRQLFLRLDRWVAARKPEGSSEEIAMAIELLKQQQKVAIEAEGALDSHATLLKISKKVIAVIDKILDAVA
ncbi:hypothetical protein HC752_04530 [Vibrio sp. S9_S30]|uniref:hypothetical protein n=1 Tax=Vibrio sp. S9_S30 TaxID=2720226 RepID=UPI00168121D6|nr:hypothetical protein [Vibrio sp. S9_S30]MBD1556194.1 hypothetical protein [Vibrio sp. S9_S30]